MIANSVYLPKRPLLFGIVLIFLLPATALRAEDSADAAYKDAFKRFSDTMYTLDYPYNETGNMTQCLQREDCGPLYFRAMTSLDRMFSMERSQLLNNIFGSIDYFCLEDKDEWAGNRCAVAIQLLYLFDSKQEDKAIMAFVLQASAKLKNLMFSRDLVWLKSRPDTAKWQDYVDNEAAIYLENKQHVNAYLVKPGFDYKETIEVVKLQHDYWVAHRSKMRGKEN